MDTHILKQASLVVRDRWPEAKPHIGVALGSGWSDVADEFEIRDSIPYEDLPGLGQPGVPGHAGVLSWAELAGLETFLFRGRRHYYETQDWTPVALPAYLLKTCGADIMLLTNSAGGVRKDLSPGDLMVLVDHINHMHANPLTGPHDPFWGPRFPDQSQVYDSELRRLMKEAAAEIGGDLREGVYIACSGPAYETPAEIKAFRLLGADAVGMSTVPEAMLASAAGMRVAGLSCITNYAAGLGPGQLSHQEVTDTMSGAMQGVKALFGEFWQRLAAASN